MDGSEDNLIFDFEKVTSEKNIRIDIEEEGESDDLKDNEDDAEDEYYENEEGNYVNIWD
ncbi:16560_t:CDS:1, partial [Funneliformis geosporum]